MQESVKQESCSKRRIDVAQARRSSPCAVHAAGGRRPAELGRNSAEGVANLAAGGRNLAEGCKNTGGRNRVQRGE